MWKWYQTAESGTRHEHCPGLAQEMAEIVGTRRQGLRAVKGLQVAAGEEGGGAAFSQRAGAADAAVLGL